MPSNRERKLQIREKQILEFAAQLIEEVGYTNLTMDALAEKSGIAKATLYSHFKSKEDVIIAATLRALNNLETYTNETKGSALEQLQDIMRYMMQGGYDADGFPSIVMHDEILFVFRNHQTANELFQRLNAHLFQLLDTAKSDGVIDTDLPNPFIVSMMMSNIQVMKGQIVYSDSVGVGQFIDLTIRVFFNGLRSTIA